jgi:multiple sugar transport system permease protein
VTSTRSSVRYNAAPVAGDRHRAAYRRQRLIALAFLSPNLLGVAAFTLIPLVAGLFVAFTNWNVVSGLGGIQWTGLGNFQALLVDSNFGWALFRTFIFIIVTVPATVLIGLVLATVLNKPIPGRAALRAIFFLPYVVNIIAVGTVWLILFNPGSGLVNKFLGLLGIPGLGWLTSTIWALPALMIITIWSSLGYTAVIYIAAMQDLPLDLYEAASIDGASAWVKFRTITWPALMPTTVFLVITTMISVSQGFGLIVFLTQGGPGSATTTTSYYMYEQGFMFFKFGYASAVGVVMFLLVLALTLLSWRLQRGKGMNE